jgi:hypothetical protein
MPWGGRFVNISQGKWSLTWVAWGRWHVFFHVWPKCIYVSPLQTGPSYYNVRWRGPDSHAHWSASWSVEGIQEQFHRFIFVLKDKRKEQWHVNKMGGGLLFNGPLHIELNNTLYKEGWRSGDRQCTGHPEGRRSLQRKMNIKVPNNYQLTHHHRAQNQKIRSLSVDWCWSEVVVYFILSRDLFHQTGGDQQQVRIVNFHPKVVV